MMFKQGRLELDMDLDQDRLMMCRQGPVVCPRVRAHDNRASRHLTVCRIVNSIHKVVWSEANFSFLFFRENDLTRSHLRSWRPVLAVGPARASLHCRLNQDNERWPACVSYLSLSIASIWIRWNFSIPAPLVLSFASSNVWSNLYRRIWI